MLGTGCLDAVLNAFVDDVVVQALVDANFMVSTPRRVTLVPVSQIDSDLLDEAVAPSGALGGYRVP